MNLLYLLLLFIVVFVVIMISKFVVLMTKRKKLHAARYEVFISYGMESVMNSVNNNLMNVFKFTQLKVLLLVIFFIVDFVSGQYCLSECGFNLFMVGYQISYSMLFSLVSIFNIFYELFVLYIVICFIVFLYDYTKV